MEKLNLLLLVALLVTGCHSDSGIEDTLTSDQALTVIAQTVDAELSMANPPAESVTQTPVATPSTTSTSIPIASATISSTITATPQSGDIPGPISCDNSVFLSDITVPDGTELTPGEVFTKTWRIQNSGTCNWDSSYTVIFVDGSIMEATSPISLTVESVPSGGVVDISVGMIAPETPGSYISYWRLQNASQVPFGVTFYVKISVISNDDEQGSSSGSVSNPTETILMPILTRTRRSPPLDTPTP